MSWTYTTKALVSRLAKISEAELQDEWCDWIEALIDDWKATSYRGVVTYTDEKHDGNDTGILFVDHPPIVAVTALSISDATYSASDYKVYDSFIKLVSTDQTEMSTALYQPAVFPAGQQNISISYTSQTATVPALVQLAATQMVAQVALVARREGSDASLKYSRVTTTAGESQTTIERYGLQSTLMDIMKKYLAQGLKIR